MIMVIHDHLNLLSPEQIQLVESRNWPFRTYLLISEPVPLGELRTAVAQQISDPNMVGIGVDPKGHHTVVRFGTGSGVPESEWKDIAKAGDAFFKKGDWAGGVNSIYQAAQEARTESVQVAQEAKPDGISAVAVVGILGAAILFVVCSVVWLWRRGAKKREAEMQAETERYVLRPYSPPSPPTTYRSNGYYTPPTRPADPSPRLVTRSDEPSRRSEPEALDVSPTDALTAVAIVSSAAVLAAPEPARKKRDSTPPSTTSTSSYESPSYSSFDSSSSSSYDSGSSSSGGGFDGGGSDSSW